MSGDKIKCNPINLWSLGSSVLFEHIRLHSRETAHKPLKTKPASNIKKLHAQRSK